MLNAGVWYKNTHPIISWHPIKNSIYRELFLSWFIDV